MDYVPEVLVTVHVGHKDRISLNSVKNLKASIPAYEKRLQIFKDDFERHPVQKANVFAKLATTYIQTAQLRAALRYTWRMMRIQISLAHRIQLLYQCVRSSLGYILRKAAVCTLPSSIVHSKRFI